MPAAAAPAMSPADLGRAFFAAQDRLRGGPDPDLCSPDYTARIGANPPVDRAGHEWFATSFYRAFPDISHRTEIAFASDDHVCIRTVLRGTHTGEFFGIPATGRAFESAIHAILRVKDGKVAALTSVFDEAGMLRQLGVLPTV